MKKTIEEKFDEQFGDFGASVTTLLLNGIALPSFVEETLLKTLDNHTKEVKQFILKEISGKDE